MVYSFDQCILTTLVYRSDHYFSTILLYAFDHTGLWFRLYYYDHIGLWLQLHWSKASTTEKEMHDQQKKGGLGSRHIHCRGHKSRDYHTNKRARARAYVRVCDFSYSPPHVTP